MIIIIILGLFKSSSVRLPFGNTLPHVKPSANQARSQCREWSLEWQEMKQLPLNLAKSNDPLGDIHTQREKQNGCGSKPMGSHVGVGEFTIHFRTSFSGWIGMFTGGTIWLLTHGQICTAGLGPCCRLGRHGQQGAAQRLRLQGRVGHAEEPQRGVGRGRLEGQTEPAAAGDIQHLKTLKTKKWLWVKNRATPTWNPGKWKMD